MEPKNSLIFSTIPVLLLLFSFHCLANPNDDDLEDDLAFIASQEIDYDITSPAVIITNAANGPQSQDSEQFPWPDIDERDVLVVTQMNLSEILEKNRFVMVEFYAKWCGHCQALAPEYAMAAAELKGHEVVLAKVDIIEEGELSEKYEVEGVPKLCLFIDGAPIDYSGPRTNKDGIVSWVMKKIGPSIYNVTTIEEAENILKTESKVVLGFLDSLVGLESEELAAASRLENEVSFYQTTSPDVAKLFHIKPNVKLPALVLLKKEDEEISHFDGQFSKSEIAAFVSDNKLSLVTRFTTESAPLIFNSQIKAQLWLFATFTDSDKIIQAFNEVAKAFKGKIIFIYAPLDGSDMEKQVSEYFGISADSRPRVLAFNGNDDGKKYAHDGEVTLSNIKLFAEDFLEDKLTPFYLSEPIPEKNNGDVKIVVGNNFHEIVLDESKDVLLEIYAPWCGHCQALEPIYNKLAIYLRGIDTLLLAKMDGTKNEHPRAKDEGFPTLLFFPASNKSSDPITVDTNRTVLSLFKFLKLHASIPFKLQKLASTETSKDNHSSADKDVKDEL